MSRTARADVARATGWGLFTAGVVLAGIYFGSRRLRDFDVALVPYAGASVFSAFGLGYRYSMWLTKPPTRLYWWRGWQLFFAPSRVVRNLARLVSLFAVNIVAQRFIEKRSPLRWAAHWCIFWGCILAAAVTFPLSFGWIHFETAGAAQEVYQAFVFGIHVFTFSLDSPIALLVFNVLDISAVLVILGVSLALWRRGRDRGALAIQQFGADLFPLVMLFAVSITGIFLTVSTHLMRGLHFVFLSQLHAVTVIFTLLYLPFGKFFHIFQRPAQLGVAFYRERGATGEPARCARCGEPFASRMHIDDLKQIERELGIGYENVRLTVPLTGTTDVSTHYQDVCPACRRKSLALTQDGLWSRGA
jgi:NNP family nitrate/nitrite transporter-like MFS transporter